MSTADGCLDYSGRDDRLSGGARRIPIDTPGGRFSVWTKRVGNIADDVRRLAGRYSRDFPHPLSIRASRRAGPALSSAP